MICVRDTGGRTDPSRSLLLSVQLPDIPEDWCSESTPGAVGWEANAQGVLRPSKVDLGPVMSPLALAQQAVDLNLRLMRWRAAPGLDINKMSDAKCLILGAAGRLFYVHSLCRQVVMCAVRLAVMPDTLLRQLEWLIRLQHLLKANEI